MIRCFIAINLPQHIKSEFEQIQADLRKQNKGLKINWVKKDLAHINIHFLGDLDENVVKLLKQNLNALQGNFGPISLYLTGVGAFPSLKNPRILFLGVRQKQDSLLIDLYNKISQILKELKLEVETRPFIAHVTLGRVKDDTHKVKFTGEEMKDIEFKVDSFKLMQSELTPEGPKYKTISSTRL